MKYKVCTLCFTYNHGPYIKDALDGFAKQETKFPVVSVIIDDASTDNTADVIRQYMNSHFDYHTPETFLKDADYGQVAYARHRENENCYFAVVYLRENLYKNQEQKYKYIREWTVNAEFIAFCEGDDYWVDPLKLEKQVAAMEKHPELDISAHAFKRTHAYTGETVDERFLCHEDKVFPMEKVIMGEGGFVGTPTLMLRSSVYENKKNLHFWSMMDYDYTLQMAGSLRGGMLYLKDSMVNKRTRVPGSFTNKHSASNKQFKVDYNEQKNNMLQQLDSDTSGKYHKIIYKRILLNNIRYYNTSKENRAYLKKYRDGFNDISFSRKIRILALCYLPFSSIAYNHMK